MTGSDPSRTTTIRTTAMTTMQQSPTKLITERLQRLNLYSGDEPQSRNVRSQSETLTSAKNHLHIPKLIFNQDFADESRVGENTDIFRSPDSGAADIDSDATVDEGDTVVHNKENTDTTLPDWMAVKLRMQSSTTTKKNPAKPKLINRNKEFRSTHLKPKLVSSVTDSESDSEIFKNETWEEMKRQYDIGGLDDDDEDDDKSAEESGGVDDTITEARSLNDTSAYSFQDMNNLRIISDAQTSSNGTKKVTSFKSDYIDSPMAPPKILKSFKQQTKPSYTETDDKANDKVEIKLITPVEMNMKFDADDGKWVSPEQLHELKPKYDDILVIEEEIKKPVIKILEPTPDNTMKTTLDIDPQQITNVSQLDLSFSESRKTLISALTSVIKPKTDWDKVDEVDLSHKRLITVKSLEEFLPKLLKINLDFNNLTTIEGLSSNLQSVSISHNKISDHFLNFKQFQYLHKIDISFNKLSNMKLFQNLRNLRELNLSNNDIKDFVELPSLQVLNVSNNEINGELNFDNFKFPNLEVLDLSGNKLSKVDMTGLKQLRILKLKNNVNLQHLEIEENSTKLKKLNLVGLKKLRKFECLDKLQSLRSLSIEGTILVKGDFPRLETLKVINDKKLENLFNGSIKVNKHLLSITLEECSIDSKVLLNMNKIHSNFPHLQRINLENNEIKDNYLNLVVFFQKFKNLQKIKLDNNPIVDELKNEQDRRLFKLMIKKLTSDC